MAAAVLVLNAGSSSIKFALYELDGRGGLLPVWRGQVEGLGGAAHFIAREAGGQTLTERRWPSGQGTHEAVLDGLLQWIDAHRGQDALSAVGHRVVHGGARFVAPALITAPVLEALEQLAPLAPLHQAHSLAPVRALRALRPRLLQVACFDTAFHHTLEPLVARFALPRAYEAQGVRRYGFHGLSYEYIAGELRRTAPALAAGRIIAAHLGNGASLCAMRSGRSADTTMGFTALDGLVMGTRCGNLDPGVVLHLLRQCGLTAEQVEHLLYYESGLLGVSGLSADMRELLASAEPHAREAVELFVFRVAREASALAGTLGGIDGLVFTAGIGEHAPAVRAAVCERLRWLGVGLDAAANARNERRIDSADSAVQVWAIPTDEERMIGTHTAVFVTGA